MPMKLSVVLGDAYVYAARAPLDRRMDRGAIIGLGTGTVPQGSADGPRRWSRGVLE